MLRWTERAAADLIAIGGYIAAFDPAAARASVEKLRQRAAKASKLPRAVRVVPEVGRADVREVLLRTYRIVYRIVDGGIASPSRPGRRNQVAGCPPDSRTRPPKSSLPRSISKSSGPS